MLLEEIPPYSMAEQAGGGMNKEQIVSYFFIGLFVFVLYQVILLFSPFFTAISWAAILAFAFYPLHEKLLSLKFSSSAASLVSTLLVVLVVVIPSATVLVSLLKEAGDFYNWLSNYISSGSLEQLILNIRQSSKAEWVRELWVRWDPFQREFFNITLQGSKSLANLTALQLAAFTKNLLVWVLNLVLITFLLFFFFKDGKAAYDFIYQLIPLERKNKEILSLRLNETFAAVIRGQFVTGLVQATIAGFTYWFLGLPLPFFFAFLTFITCLIPVTGAATVWVPMTIYLFISQQMPKAIILGCIGIFAISLMDNILKPILIGEKARLPLLLLFLGILGGIQIYGFIGLFLGPLVLSLFFVLTRIYRQDYQSASTKVDQTADRLAFPDQST